LVLYCQSIRRSGIVAVLLHCRCVIADDFFITIHLCLTAPLQQLHKWHIEVG
jgi:hypothetical protein